MNVAPSVRVFHEALGTGGGRKPGLPAVPGDSTLSASATPLREKLGVISGQAAKLWSVAVDSVRLSGQRHSRTK